MRLLYIGENKYKEIFKWNHEGDCYATEHEVGGMTCGLNPEGNDNMIIESYTTDNIDKGYS